MCCSVVDGFVPFVVRWGGVCSLADQEEGGFRPFVAKHADERGAAFVVYAVDVRSGSEEEGNDFLVAALCHGMQGRFGFVIGEGGIRAVLQEYAGNVPVAIPANIVQGGVALHIPFVDVYASLLEKYLYNAFLSVAAGVEEGLVVVHSLKFNVMVKLLTAIFFVSFSLIVKIVGKVVPVILCYPVTLRMIVGFVHVFLHLCKIVRTSSGVHFCCY